MIGFDSAHDRRGRPAAAQGRVALVGAGPGDPELLTRRGAMRLAQADLVLYDALVDVRVLDLAMSARRFCVGKRAGRPSVSQAAIIRLMIRAARRGQQVVRLKGGDPFVFGRGAEEALALSAADIPFEVVPGVTSAVAAAGLAGIPVTHRGTASAFLVLSGHAADTYEPLLRTFTPHSVTIVVMMGLRHVGHVAATLVAAGWASSTPAAVIAAASMPDATVETLTLGRLQRQRVRGHDGPVTVVIGDVVRLRTTLAPEAPEGASECGLRGVK
jgi:uroporphyrin-III C-methyltransferase / precorrin-2 dehydrogenase / sirohydrochlorin ferrochelatase